MECIVQREYLHRDTETNMCVWEYTCLPSQQTGLVKGVKLRQLSLVTVTAGITLQPWRMLGAEVPWRRLATVAVVLTVHLRSDGNTAVWGRVIWRHHGIGAIQTPGGPMTCVTVCGSSVLLPMVRWVRGVGLGWLPKRCDRFSLPRSFKRRWGGGSRGRRWSLCRFKVCRL